MASIRKQKNKFSKSTGSLIESCLIIQLLDSKNEAKATAIIEKCVNIYNDTINKINHLPQDSTKQKSIKQLVGAFWKEYNVLKLEAEKLLNIL